MPSSHRRSSRAPSARDSHQSSRRSAHSSSSRALVRYGESAHGESAHGSRALAHYGGQRRRYVDSDDEDEGFCQCPPQSRGGYPGGQGGHGHGGGAAAAYGGHGGMGMCCGGGGMHGAGHGGHGGQGLADYWRELEMAARQARGWAGHPQGGNQGGQAQGCEGHAHGGFGGHQQGEYRGWGQGGAQDDERLAYQIAAEGLRERLEHQVRQGGDPGHGRQRRGSGGRRYRRNPMLSDSD